MAGHTGPKIGNGESYGSGEMSTSIRGKDVEGGDDFYVQKLNRSDAEFDFERQTITPGLHLCCEEDMD